MEKAMARFDIFQIVLRQHVCRCKFNAMKAISATFAHPKDSYGEESDLSETPAVVGLQGGLCKHHLKAQSRYLVAIQKVSSRSYWLI